MGSRHTLPRSRTGFTVVKNRAASTFTLRRFRYLYARFLGRNFFAESDLVPKHQSMASSGALATAIEQGGNADCADPFRRRPETRQHPQSSPSAYEHILFILKHGVSYASARDAEISVSIRCVRRAHRRPSAPPLESEWRRHPDTTSLDARQ